MNQSILSSLPLQVLIYFNYAYSVLFALLEIILFIYKGNEFLYANNVLGTEIFFLVLYIVLEYIRLYMASRGNKSEKITPLIWSVLFSSGVLLIHVFYFQLQTYVLKLDRVINGISFGFIGLETLLMIFVALTFLRYNKF